MKTPDIIMLTAWGIGILGCIICCIITYIKKDKEGLRHSFYFLGISLTPFGIAITLFTILGLLILGAMKTFDIFFNYLTKDFNEKLSKRNTRRISRERTQ